MALESGKTMVFRKAQKVSEEVLRNFKTKPAFSDF
jgi:hypothetical protein